MIEWGISALSHDAALAVIKDNELVYASHSERYSRIKNDKYLHRNLLHDALRHGSPDVVYYYEKPLLKLTRQLYAKQWNSFNKYNSRALINHIKDDLGFTFKQELRQYNMSHHLSHAAGGYFTSQYKDATIVVIDAIGEWEVLTIWKAEGNKLKKIASRNYPHSLGLFYSAMTQRCGLKPNEEEYILMGMSALGDPHKYYKEIKDTFFKSNHKSYSGIYETIHTPFPKFKHNLHRGCTWWRPEGLKATDIYDVAAATQQIYEDILDDIMQWAYKAGSSNNLVFTGGCALNCVANSKIAKYWDNIWIMPSPGDSGSAIGAILANKQEHIKWPGPYLGHEITGEYPTSKVIKELYKNKIVGVASGKAEFGPRALGNRSLLADPRGKNIKDLVNKYKKREPFRPFAPMILEECANEVFDMPVSSSPYMQFTAKCKRPDEFPAIVHYDGTSRVQTVGPKDNKEIRALLEAWYVKTGCPLLLNTSLNVKGEPLVNTIEDAQRFEKLNKLKVVTP